MKKLSKRAVAWLLTALMLMTLIPSAAFAAETGALQNTLYKLKTDGKLNIGYIGGSITVGAAADNVNADSYRALTTKWIGEQFSNAAVTAIGAGVGGTGTKYGLFRADSALKLGTDEQPDLTFIEFAVNDEYDRLTAEETSFYYESLINKLYAANPNMDIVCLITTNKGKAEDGAAFVQKDEQIKLAEHYGIPVIDMGDAFQKQIASEVTEENTFDTVWAKYFKDAVHPLNEGHKFYAKCITDYLGTALTGDVPESLTAKTLPNPINTDLASDAYLTTAAGSGYTKVGNGWSYDTSTGAISATESGQAFNFKFTGTRLEIMTNVNNSNSAYGDIQYTIDGETKTKALLHGGDCRIVELASGLENKEHTVTLMTADGTISGEKPLTISGFGIAGNADKSGIKCEIDQSIFKVYNLTDNKDVRIQNLRFSNGETVVPSTEYQGNKWLVGNKDLDNYEAPFFFQWDVSSLKGKEIVSAAYVHVVAANDNFFLYDVPGDDLTLSYTEKTFTETVNGAETEVTKKVPNRIEINKTPIANVGLDVSKTAISADITGLPENVQSKYNFSVDITDYIKEQAASDNALATIMAYENWGGRVLYGNNQFPILWVKTIENDAPVVTVNPIEKINEGETATVVATATDTNGIAAVKFYVDGVEQNVEAVNDGDTYTAQLSGLAQGEHTVTVKATDTYGATGSADARLFVKGTVKTALKDVVKANKVTNPNFKDNLDYSGQLLSDNKTPDRNNFWIKSNGSLTDAVAPVFMKFDISSILDVDDDGILDYDVKAAYLLTGNGANNGRNNTPMQFYDVPSNDISIESMKEIDSDGNVKYVMPTINRTAKADIRYQAARDLFSELNTKGSFDNLGLDMDHTKAAFDLTNYVTEKNGKFSVMMYTSWGATEIIGSTDDNKMPRLYFELIAKPKAEIVLCEHNYAGEDLTVSVKAEGVGSDIEKVEIYDGDTLKATVTENTDGVYTADIADLSAGVHKIKAVVIAKNTAKAETVKNVLVKGETTVANNNYRAVVSTQSDAKPIEISAAAAEGKTIKTYSDSTQIYYQYDVSEYKKIVDKIESVTMNTKVNKFNGQWYDLTAMKTDYVISDNSTYDEMKNGTFVNGETLGRISENNTSIDVTDKFKSVLADSSYGTYLTLKLWSTRGGMSEGIYPTSFTIKIKETAAPSFVTENSDNTITVAVNPSQYAGEDNSSVCVAAAVYGADGALKNTVVRTLLTRNKYTVYNVDMPEGCTYKVFVFDGIGTLKPLLNTPAEKTAE